MVWRIISWAKVILKFTIVALPGFEGAIEAKICFDTEGRGVVELAADLKRAQAVRVASVVSFSPEGAHWSLSIFAIPLAV